MRLAGGLPVIVKQLERDGESVKTSAASCVANLSLNNRNQPILLKVKIIIIIAYYMLVRI